VDSPVPIPVAPRSPALWAPRPGRSWRKRASCTGPIDLATQRRYKEIEIRMNTRLILPGAAVMSVLAVIPTVHAQLIPKSSPVPRDGNLGPNQIVEDKSKKPFAAPNARSQPLAFGSGCPPSITKTASNATAEAATARPPGMAYFDSPINVATAAGANVRRIVVHEWTVRGWGERFTTWPEVLREVQKVWAGRFRSVNYPWSEVVIWSISASIEFENTEERGCLMTDGVHVSLRDVNGGTWLFRLLPAAQ
jgi:hypothetical protein